MSIFNRSSVAQNHRKAKPQKSETRDFLSFLIKLGLFVFVLRSFVFAPFNIPSESMLPRLMIGDYLLVTKWNYGYSRHSLPWSVPLIPGRIMAATPQRGDVVVFKAPPEQAQDYIKRVIGLPGDLIVVRGGIVSINGTPVKRERIADFVEPLTVNSACAKSDAAQFRVAATGGGEQCRYPQYRETLPNGRRYNVLDLGAASLAQRPDGSVFDPDNTDVYTVPQDHLFLMGDNRDRSADSRFPAVANSGIGIVPQANLVGKAWISMFSTDGSASWLLPWTWFTAARWDRIGQGY